MMAESTGLRPNIPEFFKKVQNYPVMYAFLPLSEFGPRRTNDILHVKEQLGHKRIEKTLIYTHLIRFSDEEYVSAVAKTVDEAKSLIETGFEYVCTHENLMLFRKRK